MKNWKLPSINSEYRNWKSPKFLNKASGAETNLAQEQASFYKTLTADYSTQFANQSAILSSITSAFQPILQAGIGQYGFTPQEDTSMRTQASDAIATNTANAQTALNENLAARGGGNTAAPSGATGQLEASLLSSEATNQANASNQITQAGYATGRQNFLSAEGALTGAAGMYNPLGFAGANTSAGSAAFNSANIVNQQNTAWEGALTGALTGAGESFLTGGASTLFDNMGGGGGANPNQGGDAAAFGAFAGG